MLKIEGTNSVKSFGINKTAKKTNSNLHEIECKNVQKMRKEGQYELRELARKAISHGCEDTPSEISCAGSPAWTAEAFRFALDGPSRGFAQNGSLPARSAAKFRAARSTLKYGLIVRRMFAVPVAHGAGNFLEVLGRGSQRDGALGRNQRHARVQIPEHFPADLRWSPRIEGLRVIDVSHQSDAIAHHPHRLCGIILGIEMECRYSRASNILHSI